MKKRGFRVAFFCARFFDIHYQTVTKNMLKNIKKYFVTSQNFYTFAPDFEKH